MTVCYIPHGIIVVTTIYSMQRAVENCKRDFTDVVSSSLAALKRTTKTPVHLSLVDIEVFYDTSGGASPPPAAIRYRYQFVDRNTVLSTCSGSADAQLEPYIALLRGLTKNVHTALKQNTLTCGRTDRVQSRIELISTPL